jgi:D-beta-D-heptose 7-phosphate kinase/D-beta-D-heptose 1-phosphate adenosyltransferase
MDNPIVVFTNGCFDGFHEGHKYLLNFAKTLGDKLVVAVNLDEDVQRLKGKNRPIFNIVTRLKKIKEFDPSIRIYVFNGESELEHLISFVHPDILVKGEDWKGKYIVGAKHIASYGGMIMFAPHLKGISTTNLIKNGKL